MEQEGEEAAAASKVSGLWSLVGAASSNNTRRELLAWRTSTVVLSVAWTTVVVLGLGPPMQSRSTMIGTATRPRPRSAARAVRWHRPRELAEDFDVEATSKLLVTSSSESSVATRSVSEEGRACGGRRACAMMVL